MSRPEAIAIAVGDAVKVFDINGHRSGQPEGGWDGEVVKVGRALVEVRYGRRFARTQKFRLATQVSNDHYQHQTFQTLAQAEERSRMRAARAVLTAHGIEFNWRGSELPVEVLEQLAEVLTAYDESAGGAS